MDPWVGQVLVMRTGSSLSGESSEKQGAFDLLSSFVFIEKDLALLLNSPSPLVGL